MSLALSVRAGDREILIAKRRITLPSVPFFAGVALLMLTNAATLVALLMASDIAKLLASDERAVVAAYEDRVAELRLEVDRLQSRHYVQTGDINLQLQDLAETQQVLREQQQYVRQLASSAAALGLTPPAGAAPAPPAPPASAAETPQAQVAAVAANVEAMLTESRHALTGLSHAATRKADAIIDTLADIGIRPTLPGLGHVGGPLLPALPDAATTVVDDANEVAAALVRYKTVRAVAALAPVHQPIIDDARQSSGFGNRIDPFTGRLAFHAGLDYAAPIGTRVLSAGGGTVSFVGQMTGYGNAVEITHGNGLVTRYGHLSAFLVAVGARVEAGSPIARVGTTGRSTGPHLHFEVRRGDSAVDPARYLRAGRKLSQILSG